MQCNMYLGLFLNNELRYPYNSLSQGLRTYNWNNNDIDLRNAVINCSIIAAQQLLSN
jgi:hypothetical protein